MEDKTFEQLCDYLSDTSRLSDKKLHNPTDFTVQLFSRRERNCFCVHFPFTTSCFGEFLNRSFRDQFVCGIRNPATRKKLLSEDRTFQQAMEVAIADAMGWQPKNPCKCNSNCLNQCMQSPSMLHQFFLLVEIQVHLHPYH